MVVIFNGTDWINPETNEVYESIIKWWTGSEWIEGTPSQWSEERKELRNKVLEYLQQEEEGETE